MKYLNRKALGSFRQKAAADVGAVVLISALLAMIITFMTVREMRLNGQSNRIARLTLAVEDLEDQLDTMESIALSVKISSVYRNAFSSRTVYNEILLIQDFKKFDNYVPYNAGYYLFDRQRMCFYSKQAKYIYRYFMKYYLKLDDDTLIYDHIINTEDTAIDVIEGNVCVFIPITVNRPFVHGHDAVLLFVAPLSEFMKRLEVVAALDTDCLTLRFRGHTITGALDADEQGVDSVVSANGLFELLMREADDNTSVRIDTFYRRLKLLTAVFIFTVLVLTSWSVWRTYRPIRQLLLRYHSEGRFPSIAKNEMEELASFMDTTLEQSRLSMDMIDQYADALSERNRWLRQQVLASLLYGDCADRTRERMIALGIELPHNTFCAFRCESHSGVIDDSFLEIVQNMDDENGRFYATRLQSKSEIVILANLSSADLIPYVKWTLMEASYAINAPISVHVGTAVHSLKKVPLSFLGACSDKACDESVTSPHLTNSLYDADKLQMILANVRSGNEDSAIRQMTELIDSLYAHDHSTIERLYMHHCIVSRLIEQAHDMKVTIPENMLSMVLPGTDHAVLLKDYIGVIHLLCRQAEDAAAEQEKLSAQEVLSYINAHIDDTSFNAEQMAEDLGMPLRSINRIIREATGTTYREYLIGIRISEAKRLLINTELSVAEISKSVGYLNIPYFIRVFKADTGYSPGEYRKRVKDAS